MAAEQLDVLFEVLEGGAEVAGELIQFPTDVTAASGGLAGEGISTVAQMGNGAAAEVSQLTATAAGSTTATTTGLGLLALDVGVVGAAVAPALGILAGVGLYNLNPEFWTNVSNTLIEAGQTIGGKVRAFLNSDTKQVGLSEETIEIFKQAFIDAGLYDISISINPISVGATPIQIQLTPVLNVYECLDIMEPYWRIGANDPFDRFGLTIDGLKNLISTYFANNYDFIQSGYSIDDYIIGIKWDQASCTIYFIHKTISATISAINAGTASEYYTASATSSIFPNAFYINCSPNSNYDGWKITVNGAPYFSFPNINFNPSSNEAGTLQDFGNPTTETDPPTGSKYASGYFRGFNINVERGPIQPGAILPNINPFPQTYPTWDPWEAPGTVPWPPTLPNIYPIEVPDLNPDATQEEAQNPDPDPDPAPWLEWLINNLPVPQPLPDPQPQPVPEPDPDPQPEPDPIPEEEPLPDEPNPPDPNPDPEIPPLPIVPDIPTTVDSNAMFTVYSPSISDLNTFGGWLWSSSIIEQILRLWQNPLDGIIAFMKVYAVPTVSAARTIQIGYLASSASAPVVTSQFVTIDCGTVQVKENKQNATDYSPYVSLHLYLPFIGIVELDPDEFMNGSISVKYTVDVYTGTCLAEVSATRAIDMPNDTILYTFSGNASQQLPLTASSFGGAISSLVSVVGSGIAIASGGAVAGIAGAAALGHSLTHEMIHVGHSGGLSSNAGIMASRKPYLIISRQHGYDANNYATFSGYPANKTVYLKNCHGFTRIKSCLLKSNASEAEKEEIISYLKNGIIL